MKPSKHAKGQLVVVYWGDAVTHEEGWHTIEEDDMIPEPVMSVGFVLGISKQSITLAADVGGPPVGEGHTNRAITIPWGMITAVDEVEL